MHWTELILSKTANQTRDDPIIQTGILLECGALWRLSFAREHLPLLDNMMINGASEKQKLTFVKGLIAHCNDIGGLPRIDILSLCLCSGYFRESARLSSPALGVFRAHAGVNSQ